MGRRANVAKTGGDIGSYEVAARERVSSAHQLFINELRMRCVGVVSDRLLFGGLLTMGGEK